MLIQPLTIGGRTRQCHLIGRFAVVQCCLGIFHMLVHVPSERKLCCALTLKEGLHLADVLSTYSEKDPDTTEWSEVWKQIGTELGIWFTHYTGPLDPGKTRFDWREWTSLVHGYEPRPLQTLTEEDNAVLQALSL